MARRWVSGIFRSALTSATRSGDSPGSSWCRPARWAVSLFLAFRQEFTVIR